MSRYSSYKSGVSQYTKTAKGFFRGANKTVRAGYSDAFGGIAAMSRTTKTLITLAFAVGILFVPWGIFQYAGWILYTLFAYLSNYGADLLVKIVELAVNYLAMGITWVLNLFIQFADWVFYSLSGLFNGQDTYTHMESFSFSKIGFAWDMHLDPNSFKPSTFDTRTLIMWLWDNVLKPAFSSIHL